MVLPRTADMTLSPSKVICENRVYIKRAGMEWHCFPIQSQTRKKTHEKRDQLTRKLVYLSLQSARKIKADPENLTFQKFPKVHCLASPVQRQKKKIWNKMSISLRQRIHTHTHTHTVLIVCMSKFMGDVLEILVMFSMSYFSFANNMVSYSTIIILCIETRQIRW